MDNLRHFFAYARERYSIKLRREAGKPAPWTDDPILRQYRFCNVFRTDDRVTRWLKAEVLDPLGGDHPRLLRAAVVFRFLNRIDTGTEVQELLLDRGIPLSEHTRWLKLVEEKLRALVAQKRTILGAAYMIKTPLHKDKVTGLAELWQPVLQRLEVLARDIGTAQKLETTVKLLRQFPFFGPFMGYEIACDLSYTPLLANPIDAHLWANPGPGATRGIGRVVWGDPLKLTRHGVDDIFYCIATMQRLWFASQKELNWPSAWPVWDMRTVEHTLCEFDKYQRAKLGEGRPKQHFRPENVSCD